MPASDVEIRSWMEANFTPYQISEATNGDTDGLFTGYYEAALQGSRTRHGAYQTPIYKRPSDLVMVNLGDFREELKGQRIAGRVIDGSLKPYEERSQIVAGAWPQDKAAPLLWVDSPVDAFFLEIQGSGVVRMDTGETLRVGFDGQNGHVYKAIGKTLVERGVMSKDEVSMQSLRTYLATHPDQAQEIMNTNRSYVFFKEMGTAPGPTGGEGVALTPTRSLAIDHGAYPYGLPFWVDAQDPENPNARLQRLMVGQDTGGAIKGAVRGDVFWGGGMHATQIAGTMKSPGMLYVFVPKSVGAAS
jgi:membrane-bound lytic murein transglycosylase A